MKKCPACGKFNDDSALECGICSVIFAKWSKKPEPLPVSAPSTSQVFLPSSTIKIIAAIVVLGAPVWFAVTVLKTCSGKASAMVIQPNRVKALIEKGNVEAVRGAIANGALTQSPQINCDFLTTAVENDQFAIFHELISSGADFGGRLCWTEFGGYIGGSPKMAKYQEDIAKYQPAFLETPPQNLAPVPHAGPGSIDKTFELQSLIMTGREDAALSLLQNESAQLNPRAANGLFIGEAVKRKMVRVTQLYLERGADPDTMAIPSSQDTLLHLAAAGADTEMIKMLLRRNANPNSKNGRGETPLDKALRTGNQENADLIRQAGGTTDLPSPQ